jgi:DNA polymerase III delta prime subunit
MLSRRNLLDDRTNLQKLLKATSTTDVQIMLEEALRGRVVDWRWVKDGVKNVRQLKGAMGLYNKIISSQSLEPEDVVEQAHQVLTSGRLNLEESTLNAALQAIASCDMRLRRSAQGRIQIEHMLFDIANINPA